MARVFKFFTPPWTATYLIYFQSEARGSALAYTRLGQAGAGVSSSASAYPFNFNFNSIQGVIS